MGNLHSSKLFETDLNSISEKMMKMGGLVESQIRNALSALKYNDLGLVESVLELEVSVDKYDVEIDADCIHLIALRQPTARDLRLIMAISKTVVNLERIGDEAQKIALCTRSIINSGINNIINFAEIKVSGEQAILQIHSVLDAFARLDTVSANKIINEDSKIDEEFRAFIRKIISYTMEDPKSIKASLDLLFIAKAIERIGDHVKNIAEFVIYVVEGVDVRHEK